MAKLRRAMEKKEDRTRDDRIIKEIVVDAHGPEERHIGWHCYLENNLIPFTTRCTSTPAISPLQNGAKVKVPGRVDSDECRHEMFMMSRSGRKTPKETK